MSRISHSSMRFLPRFPRISTQGVSDNSTSAAGRPRESLTRVRQDPLGITEYNMRLFGLSKAQSFCPPTVEEPGEDGTSRNVVQLGETVGVTGEIKGTDRDDSGAGFTVHTEKLGRCAGEFVQKVGDTSSVLSVALWDRQPPWQKGLLWVDTE